MRRLVAELVSDPHAREDVVQETLRVALERPPRSRTPGALRSWLATVLRKPQERAALVAPLLPEVRVAAAWAPGPGAIARGSAALARVARGMDRKLLLGTSLAASIPLVLWVRTGASSRAEIDPRLAPIEPRGLPADLGWAPPDCVELRRPVSARSALAQESAPPAEAAASIPDRVDAYLQPLVGARLFSGTVLLAREGEIVHSKAYGKAHFGLGRDNAPDTRFKLMSVTKSFTAVAVMTLEQTRRLELDDPVGRHLRPWPEAWSGVTLRHLLSHTSGIPNLEGQWGMRARQGDERGLAVWPAVERAVASTPLATVPGEVTSYSNFNYVLLGLVIESVSGEDYGSYLRSAVLGPAGLEHTGCDDGSRRPGLSMGYFRGRDGGLEESAQDMSVIRAAGDLYSSTLDLYRLDRALSADELLAPQARAEMLTLNGRFALGWQVSRILDRECVHHSGGANGYVADFLRFPEEGACVVVLSNFAFAPAGRIATDLAAILFGEPYEQPVRLDGQALARYEGVYATAHEPLRALLVRRSADLLLSFDVHGGVERCGASLLVPMGDGVFALPWSHGRLEFAIPASDAAGPATVRRRMGNEVAEMERRPAGELAWRAAVGSYETEPLLGSSVSIVERGGGLELRIEDGWPTSLDLVIVSTDLAIARAMETFGTQLHLTRDALGGVAGFRWERADGTTFVATRRE